MHAYIHTFVLTYVDHIHNGMNYKQSQQQEEAALHTFIHTTYMHTYTYNHIHTHTYIHIHTNTYIHIHIHTYIYIHTYLHACVFHIHTHVHYMQSKQHVEAALPTDRFNLIMLFIAIYELST